MIDEPIYRESELGDGTRLVTLGGELDLSTAGAEIRELLGGMRGQRVSRGARHVGVTFIDSAGLGLLVRTHKRLRAVSRRLVTLNPHTNVQRTLKLSGLDQIPPDRRSLAGRVRARRRRSRVGGRALDRFFPWPRS